MRSFVFGFTFALATAAFAPAPACAEPVPFAVPATFVGRTPCADCSGIDVTLQLGADHRYVLRNAYEGRPNATYLVRGRWRYDAAASALALEPERTGERVDYYRVVPRIRLEPLDANGDSYGAPHGFWLHHAR